MKKIIASILATLMLMSTVFAAATLENIGGEIGKRNIDKNEGGEVSSYLYNGSKYSFTVDDKDFEELNKLFSDENLTNSQKTFDKVVSDGMSDYPEDGKYIIKEVYDEENMRSIRIEFLFDSDGVLLREIILNGAGTHVLRQGFYEYKSEDVYGKIKSILDKYAEEKEEKITDEKYTIQENEAKISDLKILYTASFSDEKLSMNGDNKWIWGICSYKYDNGETTTAAYLSIMGDVTEVHYFDIADNTLMENNTLYFGGNHTILFYPDENFGKESTTNDLIYEFKLQFNVSDDLEILSLVYSQKNKLTGAEQTIDIDMENYIGDKKLPKLSDFKLSSANNVIYQENTEESYVKETEKKQDETIKTDEKQEEKTEKEEPEKLYAFNTLADITTQNVEKVSIACNKGERDEVVTSSPLMISNIVNSFKGMQFKKDISEGGGAGGWLYCVNFYMEDGTYIQLGTRLYIDKINYIAAEYDTVIEKISYYYDLIKGIGSSEWATDYILESMEHGFLEGVTDLSYKEPITREKFCEIVYNMLMKTIEKGMAVPSAFYFKDTYNNKVSALYYADIIKGKGERIFAPDDYLTREEAATILCRVLEFMDIDLPKSIYDESVPYYTDKDMISDWAFDAVYYMKEMGVMVGVSDTEFSPKSPYTAEQAIATIIRLHNLK